MKKDIILIKQHFLKKNYTYNFFSIFLKFNRFFLKNNYFFFKYFNYFKYFLHINFFFKKNALLYSKNFFYNKNNFIFLKNKYKNENYINLYGINHVSNKFNIQSDYNNNFNIFKTSRINKKNNNFKIIFDKCSFLYNYNIFINTLITIKMYNDI